jgi:molybdenum cofactor cytidylyltransferase
LSLVNNIGIVILAAGSSSRLGEPKQLLPYDDKNLLQHTIDVAENSDINSVIIVLGANADLIAKEITKIDAHLIENKEWKEGMASSVRTGLNELLKISPETDAVIFMVCDQPHVSTMIIDGLIKIQRESGKPIVACNYLETMGPPALFHRSLFNELKQLKGDVGARKIIQQHNDEVATLLFTEGKTDIDTKEDYDELTKLSS